MEPGWYEENGQNHHRSILRFHVSQVGVHKEWFAVVPTHCAPKPRIEYQPGLVMEDSELIAWFWDQGRLEISPKKRFGPSFT